MTSLEPRLQAEFERWCKQIPDGAPASRFGVGARDVLRAHFNLAQYFQEFSEGFGGVGPRSVHLLESAVSRQDAGYGKQRKWNSPYEVTATLFYGLIKNHPFHDANKRTALLTALYQLQRAKRWVTAPQKDLEELTVRVAKNALTEYASYSRFGEYSDPQVRFLAWYFQRHTREQDNRVYVVTARQLDALLRHYGYYLANPFGNQIDVMKDVEETYGFLGLKRRHVARRVAQTGFHDWGSEVGRRDVEALRKALKLTSKYGVDSGAFYQGLDSIQTLIAAYSGPLRRLADR